ncbi:MAG: hypothetical protein R2758_03710 [Bacteroidales bacterium]
MYRKEDILNALGRSHIRRRSDIVSLGMVGDIQVTDEGITLVLIPENQTIPSWLRSRATASGRSRRSSGLMPSSPR